jgi:monoamine oxidase
VNRGSTHDVVVIGAGLAGLHSALLLEAQGLDVLVLEAQGRIGGRIHSMRQLGSNAEAGGTYIGAGYERITRTAQRFGIRLIDVTPMLEFFREQDLVLGNDIIRQSEWPDHPANPFPPDDRALMPWNYHRVLTMRENPLEAPEDWLSPKYAALDISMHEWMRRQGLSDAAIKIGYGINTSFGTDAHDVSALLLLFRAAFSKAQRKLAPRGSLGYTVENGVQRIPEAMAGALRRDIALNHPVAAIDETRGGLRVTCVDGGNFTARHVVCSIPFGVLRRLKLEPPLAGPQGEAVNTLCAQPITQVYLRARRPFWEDDGYAASLYTDSLPGMLAAVRSSTDPATITHLTSWVIGDHARQIDALDPSEAGRRVIQAIEQIRPAAAGQLELVGLHSWGADPYAGGAWAYFQPGQIRRFAAGMANRRGNLHFCGEHLALASRGMEGAMETAETAAADVLRHI